MHLTKLTYVSQLKRRTYNGKGQRKRLKENKDFLKMGNRNKRRKKKKNLMTEKRKNRSQRTGKWGGESKEETQRMGKREKLFLI